MSFSAEVKQELMKQIPPARHCQLAELAALLMFCFKVEKIEKNSYEILISTENEAVTKKCFTLLEKGFKIIQVTNENNAGHAVLIHDLKETVRVLQALKMINEEDDTVETQTVDDRLIASACCRRAYIRGAFLAAGSISDPEKFYHLEIVCQTEEKAVQLQSIIHTFLIDSKIVVRKEHYVVYIKEGNQIVELLNVMEAHNALMKLENIRIWKEMRNTVNRKVNCEAANIKKTVSAAVGQMEDILYIKEHMGFEQLPEGLKEVAEARLLMPEATLTELGASILPPISKSCVNHRLRRLKTIADQNRENALKL